MSELSKEFSSTRAEYYIKVGEDNLGRHGIESVLFAPPTIIPGDIPVSIRVQYNEDRNELIIRPVYAGDEKEILKKSSKKMEVQYGGLTGRIYEFEINNYKKNDRIIKLWEDFEEKELLSGKEDVRKIKNMEYFTELLQKSILRFRIDESLTSRGRQPAH